MDGCHFSNITKLTHKFLFKNLKKTKAQITIMIVIINGIIVTIIILFFF